MKTSLISHKKLVAKATSQKICPTITEGEEAMTRT